MPASGCMGSAALAAAASTDLYTVPPDTVATVNVNLCNRTTTAIKVRIAIRNGALSDAHYIEYDTSIPANGVLERTGMAMSSGETIMAYAAAAGISVRVHGFEEVA